MICLKNKYQNLESMILQHISNVSLVEDGKPAKVKFEVVDGKKVRVFKKTGNKVGN